MFISVRHVTRYQYGTTARYSIQSLRLTPPSFDGQKVVRWSLSAPSFEKALRFRDGFGNVAHLIALSSSHDGVAVEAHGVIETQDKVGVVRGLPEVAPLRVFLRETEKTAPDNAIRDLAAGAKATDPLERLHILMDAVRDAVEYDIGSTDSGTTAKDVLAAGHGVCQDHAHVFISAARTIGVPSRYVNGYFLNGDDHPAEAHHAWAECWVDGLGWVGFDAANRQCPTDHYVRLACGLDAGTAAPIRGCQRGGANEALDVLVEVQQQGAQQQQS